MIHGLIVLNKPPDVSSHFMVQKLRKLFAQKKIGHFGTLDPMARGILLIALGNTTKFFNFYNKLDKSYSGEMKFGFSTTTYDREGTPVSEKVEVDLNKIDFEKILPKFQGEIYQVPPIYSAKKYKGKPLYKYARQNIKVEINPVKIHIRKLRVKVVSKDTLYFSTITSSGTYIRSLAHDIGEVAGTGAFLWSLQRDAVGDFDIKKSVSYEVLKEKVEAGKTSDVVIPIELLLPEFAKIITSSNGRHEVLNGAPLKKSDVLKVIRSEDESYFRIFDEQGKLLAICTKEDSGIRFKPAMVFNN